MYATLSTPDGSLYVRCESIQMLGNTFRISDRPVRLLYVSGVVPPHIILDTEENVSKVFAALEAPLPT